MKNYYFVYFITNTHNTVLYIGVTNNLIRRIEEHRKKFVSGFTQRYDLWKLIYYEVHEDVNLALIREKQLKKWNRKWKDKLIEEKNPDWIDLYETLI